MPIAEAMTARARIRDLRANEKQMSLEDYAVLAQADPAAWGDELAERLAELSGAEVLAMFTLANELDALHARLDAAARRWDDLDSGVSLMLRKLMEGAD